MIWRIPLIMVGTALTAACQTAQPPVIVSQGTLPRGAAASFGLAEGAVDAGWLAPRDVSQCLANLGMQATDKPVYFVQYAVAIRSESSTVSIGEPSGVHGGTAKTKGDRIFYKLLVDQLSDGARVFELSVNAAHKAAKSTPASRAALLCSALRTKAN
jgi:hypothetical protein